VRKREPRRAANQRSHEERPRRDQPGDQVPPQSRGERLRTLPGAPPSVLPANNAPKLSASSRSDRHRFRLDLSSGPPFALRPQARARQGPRMRAAGPSPRRRRAGSPLLPWSSWIFAEVLLGLDQPAAIVSSRAVAAAAAPMAVEVAKTAPSKCSPARPFWPSGARPLVFESTSCRAAALATARVARQRRDRRPVRALSAVPNSGNVRPWATDLVFSRAFGEALVTRRSFSSTSKTKTRREACATSGSCEVAGRRRSCSEGASFSPRTTLLARRRNRAPISPRRASPRRTRRPDRGGGCRCAPAQSRAA